MIYAEYWAKYLLSCFGVSTETPSMISRGSRIGDKARTSVSLLCQLLSLAVASFAGSHCSDLGQQMWEDALESFVLDAGSDKDTKIRLRRRRLACLDNYIGGPVWVFGTMSANNDKGASLSISIQQFAELWGPLYTIPSLYGNFLAIQTPGGIMYQTNEQAGALPNKRTETLVHWVGTTPPHKTREPVSHFMTHSKNGETIPEHFEPFSSNNQLLIGQPTSASAGITTMVNKTEANSKTTVSHVTKITSHTASLAVNHTSYDSITSSKANFATRLEHNAGCRFSLDEFGALHSFQLHAAGTHEAYYLPDDFSVGISAGQ